MADIEDDLGAGRAFSPWLVVGAIAIAAGFAITLEDVSVSWVGDRVTAHYRNWGALGGGAVAIVAGLLALAGLGKTPRRSRALAGVLGALVLAGGGYQVARGLGVFFDAGRPPIADEPRVPSPTPPPASIDAGPPADEVAERDAEALRGACHDDQTAPCVTWRAAAEHACELGRVVSCGNLAAALLDDPIGGPADPARGRALAAKACDAGDGGGCTNLAYAEHKGLGGPVDIAHAHEHAYKACKAESRDGCRNLVTYVTDDAGTSADEKRDAYATACFEGSILKGCEKGADLLLDVAKRSDDDEHQLRLLSAHACRLENGLACGVYAKMLREGRGGPAHADLAPIVLRHACNLGAASSCEKGHAPPHGAVASVEGIAPLDPETYETIPLLDDVEARLVPCAAMPGADDAQFVAKVTVASSGATTWTRLSDSTTTGDLDRCITEHLPATAPPLAAGAGDSVWFNVILAFGTMK